MTAEQDDALLDALLDEVLDGRTPPDLTARIMQAFGGEEKGSGTPSHGAARHDAATPATPLAIEPQERLLVSLDRRPRVRPAQRRSLWLVAVLAVTACVIGAVAVSFLRRDVHLAQPSIQEKATAGAIAGSDRQPAESELLITNDPAHRAPPIQPRTEIPLASLPTPPVASESATPSASPPPASPEPSSDTEIIAFVNSELARVWSEAGVTPASTVSEAEWCRRLFFRLLGRQPRPTEELNAFLADGSPDKRRQWVDRLLSERRYTTEYARHWSVVWSNDFLGRAGSAAGRDGLERYFRRALTRNAPYTAIVQELLTATGGAQASASDFNPAVHFLLEGVDKDAAVPTSRVARVLLGQQLQCARCHDHPSQGWSQDHFWALNSFFRQMKVERQGQAARLVNVDFAGQGRGQRDGKVFYETPAGLLKTATPRFLDGTKIPQSGELAVVDRRKELAGLVVQSDYMSKALVNRLWSHFFGFGFTKSADDMGADPNPPTSQALDRLAREFVAHGYDLKSVMRWIVLSDPFSRSSEVTDLATRDMPEAGEVALFSHYYSRPEKAADVFSSLTQAAQIRKSAKSEAEVQKARGVWLAEFNRNSAAENAKAADSKAIAAVPARIMASDNSSVRRAILNKNADLLNKVAQSKMKFEEKVEHLFLAALDRQPTRREQNAAGRILANAKGSDSAALEDIWWAILSSDEFILDH